MSVVIYPCMKILFFNLLFIQLILNLSVVAQNRPVSRSQWRNEMAKQLPANICQDSLFTKACFPKNENDCLPQVQSYTERCLVKTRGPASVDKNTGTRLGAQVGLCVLRELTAHRGCDRGFQ